MTMQVGAIVPNAGPAPASLGITTMGRAAEAAGAESLWVSDHLLQVNVDVDTYPYSPDGRPTWDVDTPFFEALSCCSFLAAATSRCRIGTAVLIAPQRNVLELAKTAATIDQLSGGRLMLGLGVGWHEQEMAALGYAYRTRGRRFDEMLQVLRSCWSGAPESFDGHEVQVPAHVVLEPRPAQSAGPPLLVGGMTDLALRRVARYGDGWLAIAWIADFEPDLLRERLEHLHEAWTDAGRTSRPELVLKLHARPADMKDLQATVREVGRLGFAEVIVDPPWEDGLDAGGDAVTAATQAAAP